MRRQRLQEHRCGNLRRGLIAGANPTIAVLLVIGALAGPLSAQERRAARAAGTVKGESLESAFKDPPATARPRVWWHWMNGNITKDGIRKDLEWMKRSGIAGVQTFDVNLMTPQIVNKRLAYMTPEWKDAFRFAAREADRLGLEMAIASSPGWSETGGPWVKPQDAMKKISWSETVIDGGQPFRGRLPIPPATSGYFQDAPLKTPLDPLFGEVKLPSLYQDTTVFAYRVPDGSRSLATTVTLAGRPLDGAIFSDGLLANGIKVPKGSADKPTIIELTLEKPEPVQSFTLAMRGAFQLFQPGVVISRLEASTDAKNWRKIADIMPSTVPTTISFPAFEAKFFRVVLMNLGGAGPAGDAGAARGFDQSAYAVFKGSPDVELDEMRLSTEARIDQWEEKAGFATLPGRYAPDARLDAKEPGVRGSDVIDLTDRLHADGSLDWTPPNGTWRVVRMGWSLIGIMNHPATPEATGLEVDKLDRVAVRRYLETYLAKYRDIVGPTLFGRRGVQALVTDSTEVGWFNWTPRLLDKFKGLRGYDPRPWLPALTGTIVGSRERSDEFLYDFRRTLGELHATEHYGTIAAVAHENGLKVYGESLEGSEGSPGDDLDMRRYTDTPMAALWTYPRDGKPQAVHEADVRGAASIAHFYGQNIVAAESMTSSSNPWAYAPADLRRVIDLEFASGVNRPVIHTSVHVPRDDKQPGLSLWVYGQYFNRMETWAGIARPWVDYIARNSLMLQAGHSVADVAYFYGEGQPIGAMSANGLPADVPKHCGYDFVSANELRDLSVDRGELVSPGGARYRVLYLGGSSERMTLPTLRRIAALAEQGATIVGNAPKRSPGLDADSPDYATLVGKLWAGGEETAIGEGRVISGRDVEKGLRWIGVEPDFSFAGPRADGSVLFVHRRTRDGDVYFVSNRGKQAQRIEASFRVKGKAPEIWRADTATIEPASYRFQGDHTIVPMDLAVEDSFFVVFRRQATRPSRSVAPQTATMIAELQGPWDVTFQAGRGAPLAARMLNLASLSDSSQPGIRYFSGIADYRKTIDVPSGYIPGKPLLIDLGDVGDVAQIRLNGRYAGTAWHAPYRVDIGRFMKRGHNQLDIRVANLWVNRLIGDAQPGATRITYTATPTYTAGAPLRRSGLIGPVRLLTGDR